VRWLTARLHLAETRPASADACASLAHLAVRLHPPAQQASRALNIYGQARQASASSPAQQHCLAS
jgi:hypothetical protein